VDQFDANSLFVGHGIKMTWYQNGINLANQFQNGHDDVEDIIGHPTDQNVLWVANHGGVSKLDLTTIPPTWTDKSDGLGVAEVWAMATSQNKPDYIVVALNHDFTNITRTPYNSNWDPDWAYLNLYGDGTACLIDRKDANYVYHSVQSNNWHRNANAESSNAVGTPLSIPLPLQVQWFAEGELNRSRTEHLYRAVRQYTTTTVYDGAPYDNYEPEIYRSFDRGSTNVVISNFVQNADVCRESVGDYDPGTEDYEFDQEQFLWMRSNPANPDHLYVALLNWDWNHRIYRSTMVDDPDVQAVKNSWEDVPHPRRAANYVPPREAVPAGIAFDPEDEHIIYVAYSSSLFEDPVDYASPIGLMMVFKLDVSDLSAFPSTGTFNCDGTYPCQDLTMNLPNTIVDYDCFVFEQGSNGGLYLATEAGVYFTNNKRITAYNPLGPYVDPDDHANTSGWVRLGGSLPHTTCHGLEINYQVNRIRAGLIGRGVWEHGLHCPTVLDYVESGTYASDDFLEAEQNITSTAVVPSGVEMTYRAGNEVRLQPGFHAAVSSDFHAFIHPCDDPGNSFKPKSLPISDSEEQPAMAAPAGTALSLYPSPADALLNIVLEGPQPIAPNKVQLFDALGVLVMETAFEGSHVQLEVRGLSGMFLVSVQCHRQRLTERVIIE